MPQHEPADAPRTLAGRTDRTETDFASFYRATVTQLVGFLVLHGARPFDATDVAQEAMTRAYQHWVAIDHPRAWVFRVASRELGRRLFAAEDPADEREPSPLWRGEAEYVVLRVDLLDAIATLPPRQRQVLAWSLYEYSPKEIAAELSITEDAVRANLYKARRAIAGSES